VGRTLRTLPGDSVGRSFEISRGGHAPAGIIISGASVSSITGLAGFGVDTDLAVVDWEEVCQLTLLSRWGAKGVFRSSSISRSCS